MTTQTLQTEVKHAQEDQVTANAIALLNKLFSGLNFTDVSNNTINLDSICGLENLTSPFAAGKTKSSVVKHLLIVLKSILQQSNTLGEALEQISALRSNLMESLDKNLEIIGKSQLTTEQAWRNLSVIFQGLDKDVLNKIVIANVDTDQLCTSPAEIRTAVLESLLLTKNEVGDRFKDKINFAYFATLPWHDSANFESTARELEELQTLVIGDTPEYRSVEQEMLGQTSKISAKDNFKNDFSGGGSLNQLLKAIEVKNHAESLAIFANHPFLAKADSSRLLHDVYLSPAAIYMQSQMRLDQTSNKDANIKKGQQQFPALNKQAAGQGDDVKSSDMIQGIKVQPSLGRSRWNATEKLIGLSQVNALLEDGTFLFFERAKTLRVNQDGQDGFEFLSQKRVKSYIYRQLLNLARTFGNDEKALKSNVNTFLNGLKAQKILDDFQNLDINLDEKGELEVSVDITYLVNASKYKVNLHREYTPSDGAERYTEN